MGKFPQPKALCEIGTRYTKTVVISEPLRWGSGFHRVKGGISISAKIYISSISVIATLAE